MSRAARHDPPPPTGGGALLPLAPADGDAIAQRPPTMASYVPGFLGWFRLIRRRAENTVTAYGLDLRTFCEFCASVNVYDPAEITFEHVEIYMAWLLAQRKLKPNSANRHRYAIQQFFKFLRRRKVTTSNPTEDTFSLPVSKRLPKYVTVAAQERTLARLEKDATLTGRRDYALIATGFFCGLRVEELAVLRLAHVDLDAGLLRVIGKGDKEREGVIIPRLAAILRAYIAEVRPKLVGRQPGALHPPSRRRRTWFAFYFLDSRHLWRDTGATTEADARAWLAAHVPVPADGGYLFVRAGPKGGYRQAKAGTPLLTRSIYALIVRRFAEVGEHVTPHMLRHSFATRLLNHGAGIELIQTALGHSDIRTTMIYAHLTTEKRRADITRFLEVPREAESAGGQP
jgi:site-specific recombinase XerD